MHGELDGRRACLRSIAEGVGVLGLRLSLVDNGSLSHFFGWVDVAD